MSEPVISVRGLRVQARSRAGSIMAVDGLDLQVSAGEVLGLIGESGSGKTTTARAMIGLLERNVQVIDGEVRFKGDVAYREGVDTLSSLRGRHIGVVFQSASATLNPLLRIGAQMRQVLQQNRPELGRAEIQARMVAVVSRMGFDDPHRVLRAYPHQLSGGMRQRAAIAIAIAPEPELLIADECTSALDVLVQADVIALLRELVDDLGMAMIFVTHDLLLAADLCSHITVMHRGRIVEAGPSSTVLRSPSEPYTRSLLAAVPAWHAPGHPDEPPGGAADASMMSGGVGS